MSSTRIQQYQLLGNSQYQQQVAGSLMAAAFAAVREPASTAGHDQRVKLARSILADPMAQVRNCLAWTLKDPAILDKAGAEVDEISGTPFEDSEVDTVVSGLFDHLAGIEVSA